MWSNRDAHPAHDIRPKHIGRPDHHDVHNPGCYGYCVECHIGYWWRIRGLRNHGDRGWGGSGCRSYEEGIPSTRLLR